MPIPHSYLKLSKFLYVPTQRERGILTPTSHFPSHTSQLHIPTSTPPPCSTSPSPARPNWRNPLCPLPQYDEENPVICGECLHGYGRPQETSSKPLSLSLASLSLSPFLPPILPPSLPLSLSLSYPPYLTLSSCVTHSLSPCQREGCYHAALELTGSFLSAHGQGLGQAGQPSLHTHKTLQVHIVIHTCTYSIDQMQGITQMCLPFQVNKVVSLYKPI